MSKSQQQKIDPEVEEVLASIRQIMANDLDDESKSIGNDIISFPNVKTSTTRKQSRENSDILTLTEMVNTDGSVISLSNEETEMAAKQDTIQEKADKEEAKVPEAKGADANGDKDTSAPLDLSDEDNSADAPQAEDTEIKVEDTEVKLVSSEDMESLMSPEAVAESAAAFSGLNQLTEEMKQKIQAGSFGTQTVDDLMREMLRPLLKEWLDSHLPSLVKWLVAEKIEQMIREKQGGKKAS
jgi:uncharacterized protein